jgi:hypothetical protein
MAKKLVIVFMGLLGCAGTVANTPRDTVPVKPSPAATRKAALPLRFSDLVDHGPSGPTVTDIARAADGQRVRMVGYMAHLEQGPSDGFYLSPTPVHGDEMGAGTGDLPLASVRVHLDPVPPTLPDVDGLVAVEGRFELGPKEDKDGRASHLRLFVDAPPLSHVATP